MEKMEVCVFDITHPVKKREESESCPLEADRLFCPVFNTILAT